MPLMKCGKSMVPDRRPDGAFTFRDCPDDFCPNLSPAEVIRLGSFGGGYFRQIKSSVTAQVHEGEWKEFSNEWFSGLDIGRFVTSDTYNVEVNKYRVRSGRTMGKGDPFGLKAWESSGWIDKQDPYGWFQWYCRFFMGRRTDDDERQISRWLAICGPKGRWKNNLIAQCVRLGRPYDDETVSPVVRQTLQHWAYRLTREDHDAYHKLLKGGAKTAFIPQSTMVHVVEETAPPADDNPTPNTAQQPESSAPRSKAETSPPPTKKKRRASQSTIAQEESKSATRGRRAATSTVSQGGADAGSATKGKKRRA